MKVKFALHFKIRVRRKSGETWNPSCLKSRVKFPHSATTFSSFRLLAKIAGLPEHLNRVTDLSHQCYSALMQYFSATGTQTKYSYRLASFYTIIIKIKCTITTTLLMQKQLHRLILMHLHCSA